MIANQASPVAWFSVIQTWVVQCFSTQTKGSPDAAHEQEQLISRRLASLLFWRHLSRTSAPLALLGASPWLGRIGPVAAGTGHRSPYPLPLCQASSSFLERGVSKSTGWIAAENLGPAISPSFPFARRLIWDKDWHSGKAMQVWHRKGLVVGTTPG